MKKINKIENTNVIKFANENNLKIVGVKIQGNVLFYDLKFDGYKLNNSNENKND